MELGTFEVFILSIPLIGYLVNVIVYVIVIIYGYFFFHKKPKPKYNQNDAPGVSIVKPLKGIVKNLEETLETHFELDYPKYELLICVKDESDEVVPLVKKLMASHPSVDSRLLIGGVPDMVNPMVENMGLGYNNAKYNLVWICSGRVRVKTDVLIDMVNKSLDKNVAIVYQNPWVEQHNNSYVRILDQVIFTILIKWAIFLNIIGALCVTGMSYIVKKPMLDACGGLCYFGKYLGEDYFLSKALYDKGYKMIMSSYPCLQDGSEETNAAIIVRQVRWYRLRVNSMPFNALVLEPIMQFFIVGTLSSITLRYMYDINVLLTLTCMLVTIIIGDFAILTILHGKWPQRGKFHMILAILHREFIEYQVIFKALFDIHTIKWGVNTYHIRWGGVTSKDNDPARLV